MLRIALIILLTTCVAASAQLMLNVYGPNNTTSGGSPPVACTNKLDYSNSCNSQYLPALGG